MHCYIESLFPDQVLRDARQPVIRKSAKSKPVKARIFRAVLRRLRSAGLHVEPFFTVHEGKSDQPLPPSTDTFTFGFLGAADFDELVQFERSESRNTLKAWIDDGKRCFAARHGGKLAATMWCDFQEFNFQPHYRQLQDDEVYLFAAYAHPDYRGMNLAPNLRMSCYQALREIGYTRFCSYTEYFNVAARRFKQKLGAENEQLRLHVCLFDRWCRTFTLCDYTSPVSREPDPKLNDSDTGQHPHDPTTFHHQQ